MKRLNKKGFTLIELLAVIIILGVLLLVALPAMNTYIENAKKDAYISTAKNYINGARYQVLQDNDLPVPGTPTKVDISEIKLERGNGKSPYNQDMCGYVLITAVGEDNSNLEYTYSIYLNDNQQNHISESEKNRKEVKEQALERGNVYKGKAPSKCPLPE